MTASKMDQFEFKIYKLENLNFGAIFSKGSYGSFKNDPIWIWYFKIGKFKS